MDLPASGLGAKEWNNSLKTKRSLLPKKLFRIRMSRNFGMKMLTMTNLSTECLIQLTKLGYDATPFNQILKQNAKREMRLRLGKVTVADVLAAQPVTTNLLKFMRASIKMIGVSNLKSFIASMTQKLTLSDISDESKNYLDKAGITTACLRIKSKWTITRRRFLNEWEAFKKVISRRNIRRRITIPLTLSNLKLLRRITRTENILHRNFTRRQVAIQNRVASNIGISQSTFSVKVLNLFSRSRRKTNKRKSKHSAMLRNKETRHRMFIGLLNTTRKLA